MREQQLSAAQKVATAAQQAAVQVTSLSALLKPLLVQAGHYNVHSRKDAYSAILRRLREHCVADVDQVLGELMMQLSRGMVDGDPAVRVVVLAVTGKVFSEHPLTLSAFFDGWLQFLLLAQTHLQADIKRDACKFLEMAIKSVPSLLVPHSGKILASLADANSQGGRPRPKSKGPSPLESAHTLLQATVNLCNAETSESGIIYAWQPVQQRSLRSCLIRRLPTTAQLSSNFAVNDGDARKIISWLGEEVLDDWLEAAPVFLLPKTSHGPSERQSYARALKLLKLLESFLALAGLDAAYLRDNLPAPIRSSPHLRDVLALCDE